MDIKRRNVHASLALAVALLASLLVAITTTVAQDSQPRTQYESFDLSTPENAVSSFVDTFRERDYPGLFLIFTPETQRAFSTYFTTFRIDKLIHPSYVEALMDDVEFGFDHTETEHSPDLTPYLFDQIMLFAEENDAFIVDLRGDVEILRSEEVTIPGRRNAESDNDEVMLPAVDVVTTVEGIPDAVTFRMVQSPSGRWQVLQVRVPGGNEEDLPWSASTELHNLPVTSDSFEGVIFVDENAEQAGLDHEFSEEITEFWTPTEDQVLALESGLVPFLQGALSSSPNGAEIWQNLAAYRRQYVGIDLSGHPRQIYANFFCANFEDWQDTFVVVMDGGNCFFQLQYDPEAGVYSDLRVNGEA